VLRKPQTEQLRRTLFEHHGDRHHFAIRRDGGENCGEACPVAAALALVLQRCNAVLPVRRCVRSSLGHVDFSAVDGREQATPVERQQLADRRVNDDSGRAERATVVFLHHGLRRRRRGQLELCLTAGMRHSGRPAGWRDF
jgi:hypothetical protein